MLAEALRTLYGYDQWATERVLVAADGLTEERFLAPGGAGHGSIRDTLVHLINVQRRWLSWWDGSLPPDVAYNLRLDPADYPDLAAVRALWEALDRQARAFVERLGDDEAARDYAHELPNGAEWRMALWQMMLHVANHGTQHRSEVAAMLTDAGRSPGDLDLLFFLQQRGSGPAN
jgi:uncharacterized damage-inducible protein DinB